MSREIRVIEQYNANDIQNIYLISHPDRNEMIDITKYAIVILDVGLDIDSHWESNIVCTCATLAPIAIKYEDIVDLYKSLTSIMDTASDRVTGYYSQYSSSPVKDKRVSNSMIGSIVAKAITRAEAHTEDL